MVINTDKTKVMLITNRQKRYNLQNDNLLLNSSGVDLKLSCNEKILGVQIEENLIWNGHFQYISKKITSSVWLFSQIKSFYQWMINCYSTMHTSVLIWNIAVSYGEIRQLSTFKK